MAKTTKQTRGIHSWIKFQKHQGVESLTIQGKDTLADVSQDKNGDTNLILMADVDKVNSVTSNVPYLGVSHSITGEDPDKNKTANISQNLTQFPLSGGELVTVTKEPESLTIHDEKVKEFVATTVTAKETEIKQFIGEVKEELTTKINEHSGGTSAEPFDKEAFKDEVQQYVESNLPHNVFSGSLNFDYDNMFFGMTNLDQFDENIELDFIHNSRIIDRLLLRKTDFDNNKTFENEKMFIKLYTSPYIANMIGGSDIEDPTGKGQLRVHVTLKQPLDKSQDNYNVFAKYYLTHHANAWFIFQKVSGDGTRLNGAPVPQ
jgi:orf14 protein